MGHPGLLIQDYVTGIPIWYIPNTPPPLCDICVLSTLTCRPQPGHATSGMTGGKTGEPPLRQRSADPEELLNDMAAKRDHTRAPATVGGGGAGREGQSSGDRGN
jgi:hypothetical protein